MAPLYRVFSWLGRYGNRVLGHAKELARLINFNSINRMWIEGLAGPAGRM